MRPNELGDFLRARRDKIQPADVDLPSRGLRRVAGLRREEVAMLAGVSTDYYTKLEHGHGSRVSDSVLDAIANALRLDPTERTHLRRLARPASHDASQRPSSPATARPGLRRLLDLLTDVPAVIVGPCFNQLAWNRLADVLFDISTTEREGGSYPQQLFLDPAARTTYPEWHAVAMEVVDYIRFNAGRDPDNTAISAVVGELSVKSPEFRSMWSQQTVRDKTHGRKLLNHHLVGALELNFETFRLAEDNGLALITYTTAPDSPSEERLRLLASWTASPNDESSRHSTESDAGARPTE